GTFGAAVNFTTGNVPFSVVAADLDGDGKTDLATADRPNSVSVLLNGCASTCGGAGFAPASNFDVGDGPLSVAVGDFNRDGRADLATANNGSDDVSVLLGNGAGGFATATNFGVGAGLTSVAVGDFNGDGKPDLATANYGSYKVSVLIGNGDGTFGPKADYGVGAAPRSVAVGDFNRDGRADLATANELSDNVSVLLGNGAGGFATATNFDVGVIPTSVAVGDFNRDGKPDIASANLESDNVSVLLGDGAGGFGPKADFVVGVSPLSVTVGDFNRDGKPDLATANPSSADVSVLLGNGAGGFATATSFVVGDAPQSVTVGDFNNDGNPDLASANHYANNVSVLLGDGAGGFATKTDFAAGGGPASVAVGDFNRDGKTDITSANQGNSVSVLLNNCLPSADLHLTVTDSPDPALVGSVLSYTVNARNRGPINATGAKVIATLPSSLAFVSASPGCAHTGGASGGIVTCTVGDLAIGVTTPDFTITAQALSAGDIANLIEVSGNEFDDFLSNNRRAASTRVNTLRRLSFDTDSTTGGCQTPLARTATVLLTGAAPAGGATVLLESSGPSAASVPSSVSVSPGESSATFDITPGAVAAVTPVTITATLQTALATDPQLTAPFTVNPIRVQSLALGQGSVQGGTPAANNVVTLACAPAANTPVALSSDKPGVASVPSGFEVPAGSASQGFTITTYPVTGSNKKVAIRAALGGRAVTQALTVSP
ncbi:MAG TPA: FG-GAP-like repeat-containing protein, partial [Pyrinomonadaceae bacterium]|nr:FG-GAP-like repeat-containing protein [Pyrinomonadaceae bacterium]